MKPQTRRSGLLIRELPDELLVYDQEQHRAHCLNRTAAIVFRHADATRTVDDLARILDPAAAGPDAASAVKLALAQLAEAGLLETVPSATEKERPAAGMSRRDAARRVGLAAAVLLPAVVSIVAPTAAEAAATCIEIPSDGTCAGQPDFTQCVCGTAPCVGEVCIGGACTGGC